MSENIILSFIHLSDIHFNKNSNDAYDLDKDLREAVLEDIEDNAKESIKKVNGVLVCGDLAFSGQTEEYTKAKEFLNSVNERLNLTLSDVYCVPGNHDVDQSLIKRSTILQCIQNSIIQIDKEHPEQLDKEIRKIQNDILLKTILFKSIDNYNEAVVEMGCNLTLEHPQWATKLDLNDKYILKIIGLNSVITSSFKDHLDYNGNKFQNGSERHMVVDKAQIPFPKKNVIYMSLCHHPPECWTNPQLIEMIDNRVKIQLYGHMHVQNIDKNSQRIRINSGALQPDRGNQWIPYYNWLQIFIRVNQLVVKDYPRIYNDIKGKFEPDYNACNNGEIFKDWELNLEEEIVHKINNNLSCNEIRETNKYTKEIVYRFSILSDTAKMHIINRFNQLTKDTLNNIDTLLDELKKNNLETSFLNELRRNI